MQFLNMGTQISVESTAKHGLEDPFFGWPIVKVAEGFH